MITVKSSMYSREKLEKRGRFEGCGRRRHEE